MYSLAFNPKQRSFLAAGGAGGVVRVWRLAWQLANAQPGEERVLERLADLAEAGE